MTMYGLTVRWSLAEAGPDVPQELRDFVRDRSLDRFTGMEGLRFKTWRMVEGEWFEGTYVWESAAARDAFAGADQPAQAATGGSPGSRIIGSPPVVYESFEVVGVAEGGAGFASGPGPGHATPSAGATPAS